ncbi:MAG: GLUG motif-containing protein, partial [Candidatus Nanopelagicales bacterium]
MTYFNGHGSGTPSDPYLVSTQLDLEEVTFCKTASFRQTADVTLSGNWTALGNALSPFTGTYDGAGFTISGLTISSSGSDD